MRNNGGRIPVFDGVGTLFEFIGCTDLKRQMVFSESNTETQACVCMNFTKSLISQLQCDGRRIYGRLKVVIKTCTKTNKANTNMGSNSGRD